MNWRLLGIAVNAGCIAANLIVIAVAGSHWMNWLLIVANWATIALLLATPRPLERGEFWLTLRVRRNDGCGVDFESVEPLDVPHGHCLEMEVPDPECRLGVGDTIRVIAKVVPIERSVP